MVARVSGSDIGLGTSTAFPGGVTWRLGGAPTESAPRPARWDPMSECPPRASGMVEGEFRCRSGSALAVWTAHGFAATQDVDHASRQPRDRPDGTVRRTLSMHSSSRGAVELPATRRGPVLLLLDMVHDESPDARRSRWSPGPGRRAHAARRRYARPAQTRGDRMVPQRPDRADAPAEVPERARGPRAPRHTVSTARSGVLHEELTGEPFRLFLLEVGAGQAAGDEQHA